MEDFIVIKNGKWQAEIAPECGGNLVGLTYEGEQILRRPADMQSLQSSPCLYGLPLLLPANRVKDARFSFQGNEYILPLNEVLRHNHLHGLLNSAPFTIQEAADHRLTTVLENNGEYYPFPFKVRITDSLSEDGLTRTLILENTGMTAMPYTLAFHATFAEPNCFTVPLEQRYIVDDRMIPTGLLRALTAEEQCYCTGLNPRNIVVTGFYTSGGNSARLDNYCLTVSEQFDNWVLFNGGGGKGYLCIEPQCGAVDGLNNGRHSVLEPGNKEFFTIKIHRNAGETP